MSQLVSTAEYIYMLLVGTRDMDLARGCEAAVHIVVKNTLEKTDKYRWHRAVFLTCGSYHVNSMDASSVFSFFFLSSCPQPPSSISDG